MDTTLTGLRAIRKAKKVTQDELARHLGLSRELIGLYEAGKSSPRLDTLRDWCAFLDCEIVIKTK